MLCFLMALLAAVVPSRAVTQPADVWFEHITIADGLSQSSIFAIAQDRHGFLWLGTEDGLNRYDGYTFTVYKHDPDDPNSLSHNWVQAIVEDRRGLLWVGTASGGLNRFDAHTGEAVRYQHDPADTTSLGGNSIRALLEDRSGALWVATWGGGVSRYDPDADAFTRFRHDKEDSTSLSYNLTTSLLEDRTGTIWVGTAAGLDRFDPETGTFTRFTLVPSGKDDFANTVTALYQDRAGTFWVATLAGIYTFDPGTCRFTRFMEDATPAPSVEKPAQITSILEDQAGVLWFGRQHDGVLTYHRDGGSVVPLRHNPADGGSLSNNAVLSIFEDRSGVLWLGTRFGLNKVDRQAGSFTHLVHDANDDNSLSSNTIASVLKDRDGVVWVGTWDGGLNHYDRRTGTVRHYYHEPGRPSSLHSNSVWALHEDRAGRLWVGAGGALERFDPATETFTSFVPFRDYRGPLGVRDIEEDDSGHLWVGYMIGGLVRFDPETETFTTYRGHAGDTTGLGDNSVLAIHQDRSGTLWLGTAQAGLVRFDPEAETFVHFRHDPADPASLSTNWVMSIHEDADGILWLGTYGGGLNRFDPRTETFTHYTEQNSDLPTNTVIGILGDADGHLWMSTHRGIARFDPRTETFRVYDGGRGLQSREFNFGAFHRAADGELFFGGINGVNAFYPEQMRDNEHAPEVVVTDLKIHNASVRDTDVLDAPIEAARAVTVDHAQNDLTFEYVGLHFAAPQRNRYAYMLENYDDAWRDVGGQRTAVYTNLDPGEYVFRVKAASRDGVWNEAGAAVRVVVRPPWWRTAWAYVAYGLLFALGVFAVDRVQRRRLLNKERERARFREAQLQARAAEAQALVLRAENDRKSRELEEARQLQLSMLPDRVPDHPEVDIAAFMRTATEVGGDYYDFHVADDGTLTAAIGDATGHGANAGTLVTATKSLFNVLAEEPDLVVALTRYTRALKRMKLPKLFMALALVKLKDGRLELAGAGMPPALIYRAATGRIDEAPLKGMPLGSFVDFPYQKAAVPLAPGDTVLLMSDGFPEMFDEGGHMFGYTRARRAFEAVAGGTPQEIVVHFSELSRQYADGSVRDDDMTFIVLKMKTTPAR